MKRLVLLVCFIAAVAVVARAADLTGTWTGEIPRSDGGTDATTFEFRIEGQTLTGTVTSPVAKYTIKEGTFDGDMLHFFITVTMGRDVRFTYVGKLVGEEIGFTRVIEGMGRQVSFVAKRAP